MRCFQNAGECSVVQAFVEQHVVLKLVQDEFQAEREVSILLIKKIRMEMGDETDMEEWNDGEEKEERSG